MVRWIQPYRVASALVCLFALGACSGSHSSPPISAQPSAPSQTPAEPTIQFFTFGDWGSGSEEQTQVANALGSFCENSQCDFGLLLGDNFYPTGVSSVTDPQWQDKFESVYSAPSLQIPFYALLGNHDHDGNPQVEIDYTQTQARWIMPAAEYNLLFPKDSDHPLLAIFILDSVYGEAKDSAQVAELTAALDASPATWKMLAFHHPLYSNGPHGDTTALKDSLIPAICHKVDLVLSGHDHIYSHLSDPTDGCELHQWVIGTGGKDLYNVFPDSRSFHSETNPGFGVLSLDAHHLTVSFYHSDLTIGDTFTLGK